MGPLVRCDVLGYTRRVTVKTVIPPSHLKIRHIQPGSPPATAAAVNMWYSHEGLRRWSLPSPTKVPLRAVTLNPATRENSK